MDFLGIGGGELFVIILIAVLLWGPGKIVEIGRDLGKFIHSLKSTTSEFTAQISKELEEEKKENITQFDHTNKGEASEHGRN
jgi:sec-independent protein translocase protein TatA